MIDALLYVTTSAFASAQSEHNVLFAHVNTAVIPNSLH